MTNTLTRNMLEAVAFLATVNSPQPVGATTLTEVKTVGNPPGPIFKLSRFNAFVGDYENMVNNQLAREGKDQLIFTAKPRKWGVHKSLALVEHKGNHYVSLKPLHTRKPVYLIRTPQGFLAPIARAAIASFLPEERHATNQGTEKEIYHRDYKLESIVSLRIAGQQLRIRNA